MILYTVIKFVHILLAITAVGLNISYGVWGARAAQNPQAAPTILRGVKFLDDRIANPAYAFLLLTGIAMVFAGGYSWTTFWIDAAIVLWVIAMAWGATMYSPALRRQIAALDEKGFDSPEYRQAASRATVVGASNMLPILLILIMMVFKPTF